MLVCLWDTGIGLQKGRVWPFAVIGNAPRRGIKAAGRRAIGLAVPRPADYSDGGSNL